MTKEFIDEMAEGAILLTGFDDCIVGITEEFGKENRILYSVSKIIQSLVKDGMDEEEALEYYSFNIIGGYFGEQNPIFLVYDLG